MVNVIKAAAAQHLNQLDKEESLRNASIDRYLGDLTDHFKDFIKKESEMASDSKKT